MENTLSAQPKKRYDWLDAIKAIAITFVIFGHLSMSGIAVYSTYTSVIKLPLFFAASGFVFNTKRIDDSKAFFKNKFLRLGAPYIIMWFVLKLLNLPFAEVSAMESIKQSAIAMLNGSYFWFIVVLFLCDVLMFAVMKLSKKNDIVLCIVSLISLVAGYFAISDKHIWMNLNVVLVAFPTLCFGYFIKNYMFKLSDKFKLLIGFSSLAVFILLPLVIHIFNGNWHYIDMFNSSYTDYLINTIQMYTGVTATFMLMPFIKKFPKIVTYIGKNTLFYYGFHLTFIKYLLLAISIVTATQITQDYLTGSIKLRLIYSVIVIALILIMIPLCRFTNKFFPICVGKRLSETNSYWLKYKK